MSWKPCPETKTLQGDGGTVTLSCDSEHGAAQYGAGHDGAHYDPLHKIRWKADDA